VKQNKLEVIFTLTNGIFMEKDSGTIELFMP